MAKSETLTEEERRQMSGRGYDVLALSIGQKALRIIDALTEALAAAERKAQVPWTEGQAVDHGPCIHVAQALLDRAQAAEARVKELTVGLGDALQQSLDWKSRCYDSDHLGSGFQQRAEAAEAEITRLTKVHKARVAALNSAREAELEARGKYGFASREERAVLDAMALVPPEQLEELRDMAVEAPQWEVRAAVAELTRRQAEERDG